MQKNDEEKLPIYDNINELEIDSKDKNEDEDIDPKEIDKCCLCNYPLHNTPFINLTCDHNAHNFCLRLEEKGAFQYLTCGIKTCKQLISKEKRKIALKFLTQY